MVKFTSIDWSTKALKPNGSEDGSHMFEVESLSLAKISRNNFRHFFCFNFCIQAIGLLIGMEDVSPEKQTEYLSALLTPLCQQVSRKISKSLVSTLCDDFQFPYELKFRQNQ